MTRYYTKPYVPGDEYVQAMHRFCDVALLRLNQLPARWDEDLIRPAKNAVLKADDLTVAANKVYLNFNDPVNLLLNNLEDRIRYLSNALEEIQIFDSRFDKILRQEDLLSSEVTRMKRIFERIIEEEKSADEKLSAIDIKVIQHISEMEYRSSSGDHKMRLALTSKQKDTILGREEKAIRLISERLTKDRFSYKSISSKTYQQT